jgi:hypothetical protein
MLSQFDEWRNSKEAHVGAECLLDLWERSLELHPYMFFMGTDFRKLKAPFVWYDILHVLDVLSSCSWLKGDPRLLNMANLVKSKADAKANTRLNRNGKLGAAGISPEKTAFTMAHSIGLAGA